MNIKTIIIKELNLSLSFYNMIHSCHGFLISEKAYDSSNFLPKYKR